MMLYLRYIPVTLVSTVSGVLADSMGRGSTTGKGVSKGVMTFSEEVVVV
jgi:hypothetical protein